MRNPQQESTLLFLAVAFSIALVSILYSLRSTCITLFKKEGVLDIPSSVLITNEEMLRPSEFIASLQAHPDLQRLLSQKRHRQVLL